MKKLLLAALLVVAGCRSNCGECYREEPKPAPQPVVQPAPMPAPCCPQQVEYRAPAAVDCRQEVSVPMTKTTRTYKVIEYKRPPVEVVSYSPGEYRTERVEGEPVVEVVNQPVTLQRQYREVSAPQYRTVKEPVKLVAPKRTYNYYTEDDWVK